jgi:hypothetical protein
MTSRTGWRSGLWQVRELVTVAQPVKAIHYRVATTIEALVIE